MTDTPNRIELLELADREASRNLSRGGYDNKYRKLRGIGAYSQRTNVEEVRRGEPEIGNNVGNVDEQQGTADSGEYP